MASGGGTVVEPSTQIPTIVGLNPATGTGRVEITKKSYNAFSPSLTL
jgi:hypothetical protein